MYSIKNLKSPYCTFFFFFNVYSFILGAAGRHGLTLTKDVMFYMKSLKRSCQLRPRQTYFTTPWFSSQSLLQDVLESCAKCSLEHCGSWRSTSYSSHTQSAAEIIIQFAKVTCCKKTLTLFGFWCDTSLDVHLIWCIFPVLHKWQIFWAVALHYYCEWSAKKH